MASFNKVILIGNICADPELKQTPNGVSVTSFSIAVARQGKDAPTDFFPVVAWRQTAEFVCKYFHKGNAILVCGSLQTRSWTDNAGNKRSVTEVMADEARFVERKAEAAPAAPAATTAYPKPDDRQFEEMTPSDDLPF